MSVRTGTLTRLNHRAYSYGEMDPTWSPDGRWIAFSAIDCLINGRVCSTALWIMRPNGSAQRRLINADQIENPSWSPDGRSIAFESNPHAIVGVRWDGNGEGYLRMVVLRTKRPRSIGLGAGLDQPSWGPDGILVSQPSRFGGS